MSSSMWSKQPCTKEVLSSSSKSYTSNSSSSSILQPITRRGTTIDEVWNNITTLHHNHQYKYSQNPIREVLCHQSSSIRGMNLQDFLAVPLLRGNSTDHPALLSSSSSMNSRSKGLLPPATVLSLNSAGFDLFPANNSNKYQASNGNHDDRHRQNPTQLSHSPFMPTTPLADATGMFSFCGKKRLPEQLPSDGTCDGVDRRHKRMIKNRESAARSRARKQAYTNELEVEVNHLNEENNRLRRQHDEMKMALAAQTPMKKKLLRTKTAPF